MEKKLIYTFSLLFIFVIVSFMIAINSFKDKKFTCSNYILNTYLYIILSLIIVSLIVLIIQSYFNNRIKLIGKFYWIFFVIVLLSLMATLYVNPQKIIIKHIFWFIFIFLMGITLYPIYQYTKDNDIFLKTTITCLVIVLSLTFIAFIKPEFISLSWGPVLLVLLIAGIIMRLCDIFLNKNKNNNWTYYLSYFFVFIFSFLLLYDTKKLQVNAKTCKDPDYINESIGIFLDIINIYSNTSLIQ